MKAFSTSWKGSKKPKKQRKYSHKAPLHIKQKSMHTHLAADLRKKFGRRSIGLRKGDKIKIMRGNHKGHTGKVERIDLKKSRVWVTGMERDKKDGSKTTLHVTASNLIILELHIDDKLRQKKLEQKMSRVTSSTGNATQAKKQQAEVKR